MSEFAKNTWEAFSKSILAIIDGRAIAYFLVGFCAFLTLQDLAMAEAMFSTCGLVFISLAFATIARRSIFHRLDLSDAIHNACTTSIGAALVTLSAALISCMAMYLACATLN